MKYVDIQNCKNPCVFRSVWHIYSLILPISALADVTELLPQCIYDQYSTYTISGHSITTRQGHNIYELRKHVCLPVPLRGCLLQQ